jgi:hypothetical protein
MLKVSLPGKSTHQFKVFYLAKDEEEVAGVAAAIDVLLELEVGPYKEDLYAASERSQELKEYLDLSEAEGSILVPVLLNRNGLPRYLVSKGRSSSVRSKLEYWRSVSAAGLVNSYRNIGLSPSQFTVYPGFKDLIVCGERRGKLVEGSNAD